MCAKECVTRHTLIHYYKSANAEKKNDNHDQLSDVSN